MKASSGLFTSNRSGYSTPVQLYTELNNEFHFNDDPCPLFSSGALYPDNGLSREWGTSVFINPPYGRAIAEWMRRAYDEALKGKTIVCLVPSRTDTRWWHDYCMKASEIRFIRGRLKFGTAKYNAPFPSAIVIFNGMVSENKQREILGNSMAYTEDAFSELNNRIQELMNG